MNEIHTCFNQYFIVILNIAIVEICFYHIFSAPYKALVVKASGLAAGKGVIVASSKEEAVKAIDILKQVCVQRKCSFSQYTFAQYIK